VRWFKRRKKVKEVDPDADIIELIFDLMESLVWDTDANREERLEEIKNMRNIHRREKKLERIIL